ncbi:hypothetical protein LUZ60_007848 [Juncus effusus]|nr:hypothetical protein LUZ60_007848 [Juncus effusus]
MDDGDHHHHNHHSSTPQYSSHFYSFTSSSSGRSPNFPSALSPAAPAEAVKRKRGRPRKYGVGASVSPSLTSSVKKSPESSSLARVANSPLTTEKKKKEVAVRGEGGSSPLSKKAHGGSLGQGFTPHVIIVKDGEDVSQKILQFLQETRRAICILSANGAVSTASLRQPGVYGGQITIEGRYEITSLCGSFLPSDETGVSRTGGLSVCLSGLDVQTLMGGGVAGPLVAAGPVTVIAGSFSYDTTNKETSTTQGQQDTMPANQGLTLVTPRAHRASMGSTERVPSHDQIGSGGNDFFLHPNPLSMNFMTHQWRGDQEGPSGATRSADEDIRSGSPLG